MNTGIGFSMKRPKDWRIQAKVPYEEGGRAIGRVIMHDRSREPYLWSLLSGTGMWQRWHLNAFATLYREENIREYNAQKAQKHRWRKRALAMAQKEQEARSVIA
jgi:hypothetical protein